jgi:NAD(P)-dependent dehydrogenase (short-subunit alcohol dehydrogenase family)
MTTESSLGVPRFALITGAGSGIGRAICRLLAREACAGICLADLNKSSLERVAVDLASAATNPQFRTTLAIVDVRDETSVQKMVAGSVAAFGRLDYAVNCAGIGAVKGSIADGSMDNWNEMISVNMTGVWARVKEEIRVMRVQQPRDNG